MTYDNIVTTDSPISITETDTVAIGRDLDR